MDKILYKSKLKEIRRIKYDSGTIIYYDGLFIDRIRECCKALDDGMCVPTLVRTYEEDPNILIDKQLNTLEELLACMDLLSFYVMHKIGHEELKNMVDCKEIVRYAIKNRKVQPDIPEKKQPFFQF